MLRHRFVRPKARGETSGVPGVGPAGTDVKAYRDRFLSPSLHLCSCQALPTQTAPGQHQHDSHDTPLPNTEPNKGKMHGHQSHSRRRKRRPLHGVKSVDVTRGKTGYGFTISGQHPCVLSCIVSGSPAERAGLKPGDYLVSVNGENVSKAPHDNVVRMIGTSTGTLTLQVAENYNSSDSSDDDYHVRPKSRYPNRVRSRHVIGMSPDGKVLKEQSQNARVAQYIQESRSRASHKGNFPYKRQVSSGSSHSSQGRPHSPMDRLVHVDTKWGRLSSCSASRLPDSNKPGSSKSHVNSKSHSVSNLKSNDRGVYNSDIRPGVYPGRSAKPSTRVRNQPVSNYTLSQSFYSTPSLGNQADISSPDILPVLHRRPLDHSSSLSSSSRCDVDQSPMDLEIDLPIHDPDIRAVVGYVGTIEMPGQDNRLQHIRNAVRRLRVEQKIHTLVLMEVLEGCVKLTNTVGCTVAEYATERIVFSGVCPDDKRFFGLVTSHNPEDQTSSSSCHVFMVDPELQQHKVHEQKAAAFNIHCSVDPDTQNCREFPRTASPLVNGVSRLYRDRLGGLDTDVIRSQIFAEPVVVPERHHSSSSNSHDSDSGLGFSKEDNQLNERVYIVDVSASFDRNDIRRASEHDSFTGSAPDLHHLSPDVSTMPTPHYRNYQHPASSRHAARRLLNASSTSEESLHRAVSGKLNLRAMPDPPSLNKYHSNNALELRHSAESMRRSMHKFLQARQRYIRDVPGTSSDQESQISFSNHPDNIARSCSHSSIQERPASAPFKQLTQGLTVLKNKPIIEDLSDKLSPKAFLPYGPTVCSPAPPVRSPSAPPLGTRHGDSDSDEEFDTDSEKKLSRFDEDQMAKLHANDGPRRFSEGYALSKKREKEKSVHAEIQRWTKTGSLRRPKNAKKTLSQSHESLIVTDGDLASQQKLLSANSVNSISGHGTKKCLSQEAEVGRVAGWAVNFEKLLCDSGGLSVFTEFLKKEFSEENIVFWKICLEYKKIGDLEERKLKAKEIYDKHVSSRALEPVNIDSQARQRCEEHLELPSPEMFDVAQQQIFQLMKQDSYSRFLRSDLYKSCLMAEIEGKPLDFLEEDEDAVTDLPLKEDKKLKKNGEPEVKRRKSLLPWVKNKSAKPNTKVKKNKENKDKEENNNNSHKKSGFATVDLSLMSKEVAQTVENIPSSDFIREDDEEMASGNYKFCRIILPDGSSTVVCAKPGQSTHSVLNKLCEKRNFSVASVDVFLQGSDKALDLNNDISSLGSKDIILEKRVLFRMDLPNHKFIGVKAKPNRSIRDVFKPILHKYGYKIDGVVMQLSDHTGGVDIECPTSSLDNKRVLIRPKDDVIEWSGSDGRRLTNGRPPVPPRTKPSQSGPSSLDELTNKVFEDLMQGKSEMAHNFDELGILDPDRPAKSNKNGEDHRLSGLFGLLRRESLGAKDPGKPKVKNKVTFALQKSENRKRGKGREEDNFLDLLSRMQSQRIDDQRGVGRESLELPDFLLKPSAKQDKPSGTKQTAASAISNGLDGTSQQNLSLQTAEGYDLDDFDDVEPSMHVAAHAQSQTAHKHNRKGSASSVEADFDSRTIRSFKTFGSPTEKAVAFTNCSFSQDCVIPSYDQALSYFSSFNHPANPDFDDPMLMVRSVSDLGLNQCDVSGGRQHQSAFKPPLVRLLPPEGHGLAAADFRAPKASPEKFSSSSTDPELSSPNDSNSSMGHLEFQDYTVSQNGMCESGVTVMQRRPFQSILEQGRVNSANPPRLHQHSASRNNTDHHMQNFENHLAHCLTENQKLLPTEKHQSTKPVTKKRLVRVNGASNIGNGPDSPGLGPDHEARTPKELSAEFQHHRSRTRKPVYLQTSEPPKPSDHQVTFV